MDYVTLTSAKGTPGSLADWVNDSRIQNDAPFIIEEAQSNIYRILRHWQMMPPPVQGTMTQNSPTLTYPADMLEPNVMWILPCTGTRSDGTTITVGMTSVDQKTAQDVINQYQYDSSFNRVSQTPTMFWFDNTAFNFDSPADIAYSYLLLYYQQPALLSASNPTNFLTARYQRLMRCAIMLGAVEWLKESGQGTFDRTYWQQQFDKKIEEAQMESDRARRGTIAGPVYIGGAGNSTNVYGSGWRA